MKRPFYEPVPVPEPNITYFYGAVDFLIVPYKGMHEWGGGGRERKVTLCPCSPPPTRTALLFRTI